MLFVVGLGREECVVEASEEEERMKLRLKLGFRRLLLLRPFRDEREGLVLALVFALVVALFMILKLKLSLYDVSVVLEELARLW